MTKDGILFAEEGLADLLADEIREAIDDAGHDAHDFRLNASSDWWVNDERRFPDRSAVRVEIRASREDEYEEVGHLHVWMDSAIKTNPLTGMEYLGKEVVNHEILIDPADGSTTELTTE